jgi:hypothetical protein
MRSRRGSKGSSWKIFSRSVALDSSVGATQSYHHYICLSRSSAREGRERVCARARVRVCECLITRGSLGALRPPRPNLAIIYRCLLYESLALWSDTGEAEARAGKGGASASRVRTESDVAHLASKLWLLVPVTAEPRVNGQHQPQNQQQAWQDDEPVVKSPPEPTRVKSPEQMIMRSPEPVNWTVPLDTGKTFTVTQNVREGEFDASSPSLRLALITLTVHCFIPSMVVRAFLME